MDRLLIVAIVLAAAAGLWWFLRARRGAGGASGVARRPARKRNGRVTDPASEPGVPATAVWLLAPGQGACNAARELGQQRLSTSDTQALPLPGCRNRKCNCGYRMLTDRRRGERRSGRSRREAIRLEDSNDRRGGGGNSTPR